MTERSDLHHDPDELTDDELDAVAGGVTITNNHLTAPMVTINNNHRVVPEAILPEVPDPWLMP